MSDVTTTFTDSNSAAAPRETGAAALDVGFLYVLSVLVAAGLADLGDIRVAGMAYTGWLWSILLAMGIVLLEVKAAVAHDFRNCFPARPWLLWLAYLWASLAWCSGVGGRNLQEATQISMPVVIGIAAAEFVRTEAQLRLLLRTFGFLVFPLAFCVAGQHFGILGDPEEQGNRVLALTAAAAGCVFLAASPPRYFLSLSGWAVCLGLTFLTGSRMATFALLVVPFFHPIYRSIVLRGLFAAALAGLGIILFYSQTFQQRFFASGHGTLADLFHGHFLGFGRFEIWPVVWKEAWQSPVLGHGVGSIFSFVPTVWPGMTYIHNDYLRIGYELGIVGVVLFVAVMLWQLFALKRRIRTTDGFVRQAYAAAYLGLVVFAIVAMTDNLLIYNIWFTNPLFALLGAAYGVDAHTGRTKNAHLPWDRGEASAV